MAGVSYQLIFRNATIADGTGGPFLEGDVAVRDGAIAQVGGHVGGRAAEEVDARDLLLAPGFIDPHTHLDANLFWDADVTPSSSFGVTTVVTANCGYGLAPVFDEEARQYLVAAMSTVEQIPEASFESGVPFDWSDLPSYSARLDHLEVLINHAFLIGHVPLRAAVLGVPAAHTRQATTAEIGEMTDLLRQGIALGALGFSTDQVVGNPGPGGTDLPGRVCGEEELLSFATALGQGPGPGLFTMANAALLLGRKERMADLEWHQRLAAASGRPVVVGPIFDSTEDPGGGAAIMDLALAGRRSGLTVVPQISTRPFELWTRLDSAGALVRSLPSLLAAVRAAGADGVRALAADPEARALLRREGAAMPPNPVFNGRWDHVRVRYSHQPGVEGKDFDALGRAQGCDPVDLLLDMALADDFETQVAVVMRNGDDDQVARLVAHPAAMIGASDAGAHVLANTDSCYAVWTLQHWVRERQVLSLERAVAMLTGDQARLLGLADRGLVQPRLAADLVLFDPDRVATTGVRFVDDQPAGGRRLVTEAQGVEMSVVNGEVATRQGHSTGARSGRRLRPAP
jgi:N-acyl-D-amino-acid deacylase